MAVKKRLLLVDDDDDLRMELCEQFAMSLFVAFMPNMAVI